MVWMVRGSNPSGARFSACPNQPWGPPSILYNEYRFFPGRGKYGRGVLLTTHPLLVPWSRKIRAIPLPTLWATTGPVTGTFTFIFEKVDQCAQRQELITVSLVVHISCEFKLNSKCVSQTSLNLPQLTYEPWEEQLFTPCADAYHGQTLALVPCCYLLWVKAVISGGVEGGLPQVLQWSSTAYCKNYFLSITTYICTILTIFPQYAVSIFANYLFRLVLIAIYYKKH
jgi:hypothetical protein